jgi:hypothetical protein
MERGHTFVVEFANPPQIARIRISLFHVVFQGLDAMLASHELGPLVVEIGPVSERWHMLMLMLVLDMALISI